MSAEVETMAYVGQVPWHGLGNLLTPEADLETWIRESGLSWKAEEAPLFALHSGAMRHLENKKALLRSDTGAALSVVGADYKVVQPGEVLEFYRSLIDKMGFQLETAGALFNGRRVWALARTGESLRLMGQDEVNGYVLLGTSYDGTMATLATRTTVRVVCNNTLSLAVGADGSRADIKIPHAATFNADMIKGRMGLETNEVWTAFEERAQELAKRKVKREEAVRFFIDTFYPVVDNEDGIDAESKAVQKRVTELIKLWEQGVGADLRASKGTAWGLVNAVTRWTDHERNTRSVDARLNRAWFGDGVALKQTAWDNALALAA